MLVDEHEVPLSRFAKTRNHFLPSSGRPRERYDGLGNPVKPEMRVVGEQHPYLMDVSHAKQAWHWHVEPGHYSGFPGEAMPDWFVKILGLQGFLR